MSTVDTSPIHPHAIPAHRTRRLLIVAVAILLASAAYGAYWWSYDRFYVRTDNAYVTGNFIPVAAQASGIVTQVLAEETQFVNKGDLVIRLDQHQASAALGRARGHSVKPSAGLPRSSFANASSAKNCHPVQPASTWSVTISCAINRRPRAARCPSKSCRMPPISSGFLKRRSGKRKPSLTPSPRKSEGRASWNIRPSSLPSMN